MLDFTGAKLFPQFLLNDKNGYAMAMAILRGMELYQAAAEEGIGIVMNVETMPEWRLDELAWEYNCLYDYTASIEAKREWIRQAISMYQIIGTKAGIYQYLRGYFTDVKVLENWEYGGDPFHFRIETTGEYDDALKEWALEAAERVKNVRSVLNRLTMYRKAERVMEYSAAGAVHTTQVVTAKIEAE